MRIKKRKKKKSSQMSFEEFLNNATILLVDDARTFDINEWEEEHQSEIDEETSETTLDDEDWLSIMMEDDQEFAAEISEAESEKETDGDR